MSLNVGTLVAYLQVDDSDFNAKTDRAEGKFKGMGPRLGEMAKAGAAALGAGLAVAGAHLYNTGRDLQLLQGKTATVFGDMLPVVEKWADGAAAAMGMTTREAAGAAASFADLLIPMGFTRKAAADMSTDVVGLSGALAEWSGGQRTAAEVSDILAKAMLGERDGLKELGISISEADVQARLLKNGQDKLTGAALEQAKAVATQQLIMEKSTDAQTKFAEGAGTLARRQAETSAKFREARDDLAVKLLPAMVALSGWVTETGIPALTSLASFVQRNSDTIGFLVTTVGTAVVAFMAVSKAIAAYNIIATAMGAATTVALGPVGLIIIAVAAFAAGLVFLYKRSETFRDIVTGAFGKVLQAVGWVMDKIGDLFGALGHVPGFGWAKTAADKLHGAAEAAGDLAEGLRRIPPKTRVEIQTVLTTLRQSGSGTSELGAVGKELLKNTPRGATGGIVTQPTLAWIGEAGPEAVVPLNRTPGSRPLPEVGSLPAGGRLHPEDIIALGKAIADATPPRINIENMPVGATNDAHNAAQAMRTQLDLMVWQMTGI